ncbi:MAG: hypothetical protein JEY71_13055 [Sphaerochaeta sp.]|nr:hypothetical protein [Sphaerochaeta sp.]
MKGINTPGQALERGGVASFSHMSSFSLLSDQGYCITGLENKGFCNHFPRIGLCIKPFGFLTHLVALA